MSETSTRAGYGRWAVAFHWLMVVLIVVVYCTMLFKTLTPKGSAARQGMAVSHYMLGLSVFLLVWLRLWVRYLGDDPVIEPALPRWQSALAIVVHWALYALMIGLPLLGWLTLSARGTPVPFFGLELPALIGRDEAFAKTLKSIHETGAAVGYYLVGLHVLAALYHHFIRRDNTLRLMLTGRWRDGPPATPPPRR